MCIIAYVRENVALTDEQLRSMWTSNPHGAGFTYFEPSTREWICIKGLMTLEETKNELKKFDLFENTNHRKFVIHLRHATHGSVTKELTHPFELKLKDTSGYLFHNGVFSTKSEYISSSSLYRYSTNGLELKPGESDTSAFVRCINELNLTTRQLEILLKEGGLLESLVSSSKLSIVLNGIEEPILVGNWSSYQGHVCSNTYSYGRTYTYDYTHTTRASYSPYYDFEDDDDDFYGYDNYYKSLYSKYYTEDEDDKMEKEYIRKYLNKNRRK